MRRNCKKGKILGTIDECNCGNYRDAIILLENGQVVRMSFSTNLFKKSLSKELVEIIASFLIVVTFVAFLYSSQAFNIGFYRQ